MRITLAILLALSAAGCSDFTDIVVKDAQNTHLTVRKPSCEGKPTIIAVIDTGFGFDPKINGKNPVRLCKYGHKNFASEAYSSDFNTVDPVPIDNHGHGTNIAGLIDQYAKEKNINYCLVILEYFDPLNRNNDNVRNTIAAINYATALKVDFINYSGGGTETNEFEVAAVKNFLDHGGKFVAAAGNEHADLAIAPYYPAMDDERVIVVGNMDGKKIQKNSNFGTRINFWEQGTDVISLGIKFTGTSQATAIVTGKLVGETKNFCK